jgi:hypothetical protein
MEMIDILQKLREYQEAGHDIGDAVENVQRTNPAKVDEGALKQQMHGDAENMSREEFVKKYGQGSGDFWDSINGVEEAKAKPDFLDMDKDGNKSEPMKKAIKDKEKMNESVMIATDTPEEASMMMQILKLAGVKPVDQDMINQQSEPETEEYANEPDEKMQSIDDLVNTHSGGLNRQKQQIKKGYAGDNELAAMSQKQMSEEDLAQSLKNQYSEFKANYEKAMNEAKQVAEKKLTKAEKKKKEEIVKSMKKDMPGMKKRYGKRAKEVAYATATKIAKKKA